MQVIDQSHEILNWPTNPLIDIEVAARTCYKSEDKITDGSAEILVAKLIARGHGAMLEFADATVRFITNRGVTHELVRHRLCSFAQSSTRYINHSKKGMTFIRPSEFTSPCENLNDRGGSLPDDEYEWMLNMEQEERSYNRRINVHKWSPQRARGPLPNDLKTEIVVKTNMREWLQVIFSLRCAATTHPDMWALMRPVLLEFAERSPVLFGDLAAEYQDEVPG